MFVLCTRNLDGVLKMAITNDNDFLAPVYKKKYFKINSAMPVESINPFSILVQAILNRADRLI